MRWLRQVTDADDLRTLGQLAFALFALLVLAICTAAALGFFVRVFEWAS